MVKCFLTARLGDDFWPIQCLYIVRGEVDLIEQEKEPSEVRRKLQDN